MQGGQKVQSVWCAGQGCRAHQCSGAEGAEGTWVQGSGEEVGSAGEEGV